MSTVRLACVIAFLAACGPAPAQTSQPAELQRGEFHTNFTERSPLSSIKEIARRFGSKPPANVDYDLSAVKFAVYVPKDYDPATPCGLIIFLCYKHSEETAPTLHDLFDKSHLIFAVTHEIPTTPIARIGTSLDAVYNLSKIYKIDPNRVWVMGEPPAQDAAMGFPDVFTAGIYRQEVYFRQIPSQQPGSGAYKEMMARPLPEYVSRAKLNRHVHLLFPNPDEYHQLVLKAFEQDGFKQLLSLEVGQEPYHYPNFTTDWMEKVIEFLDAPPAAGIAAAHKPASQPAADAQPARSANTQVISEAQKSLNLAKSYIAAHSYGPARTRLNAIIEKYPDDPAATEARKLLQTLP